MAEPVSSKPPFWFMIAALAAVLWGVAGAYACYSQLTLSPAQLAALPPAQADAFSTMPIAIRIAYVVATAAGFVGAVLLALRSRLARIAFIVSLIGVIVQFGWLFGPYQGVAKLGPAALGFPGFIVAVGVLEILFADLALRRGWLS